MSVPRPNTVGATIERADSGGFTAIASNGDLDRDNERIMPGCMSPLPASVPIHLDHTMSAASVVARGRPYYVGDQLRVDATFASTRDAQDVRAKVLDGVIDSMSIVFRRLLWKTIEGVRTCVKGELLAADIVSVPSNSGARILSMRSARHPAVAAARRVTADALVTMARCELAQAKALLAATDRRGPVRRRTDALIREVCTGNEAASTTVRRFLRSI
jgi:HK97 family phage prohead protease